MLCFTETSLATCAPLKNPGTLFGSFKPGRTLELNRLPPSSSFQTIKTFLFSARSGSGQVPNILVFAHTRFITRLTHTVPEERQLPPQPSCLCSFHNRPELIDTERGHLGQHQITGEDHAPRSTFSVSWSSAPSPSMSSSCSSSGGNSSESCPVSSSCGGGGRRV